MWTMIKRHELKAAWSCLFFTQSLLHHQHSQQATTSAGKSDTKRINTAWALLRWRWKGKENCVFLTYGKSWLTSCCPAKVRVVRLIQSSSWCSVETLPSTHQWWDCLAVIEVWEMNDNCLCKESKRWWYLCFAILNHRPTVTHSQYPKTHKQKPLICVHSPTLEVGKRFWLVLAID